MEECAKIQELLAVYEDVSGQMINREKKTLFFFTRTQMCKLKRLLKWHLMFQPSSIMRSTWSCHLLLVETKRPILHRLKKGSGLECKVGRKSSCLKLVRK